jgi:hypothetical protein
MIAPAANETAIFRKSLLEESFFSSDNFHQPSLPHKMLFKLSITASADDLSGNLASETPHEIVGKMFRHPHRTQV